MKKIIIGLAIIILLFIVAGVIVSDKATDYAKRVLVEEFEKNTNARLEIGDLGLSVFKPTADIKLKNVKIGEKDSYVKLKVPHDDRPKIENARVLLESAELKVSWQSFLQKNIIVTSVKLDKFQSDVVLYKEGGNSLEQLFKKPQKNNQKVRKSAAVKQKKHTVLQAGISNEKGATVLSGFAANLEKFHLINSQLNVRLQSASLLMKVGQLELELLEKFSFSLDELVQLEPTKFKVAAQVELFSKDEKEHYGDVGLRGQALGDFFVKKEGESSPEIEFELILSEGSYLCHIPVLDKLSSRFLKIREIPVIGEYAVDKWEDRYEFGKDQKLRVKVKDSTYSLLEPLQAKAGGWSLILAEKSWVRSTDTQHVFHYWVQANSQTSKKMKSVFRFVLKQIPQKYSAKSEEEAARIFDEKGIFSVKFRSTGALTKARLKELSKIPKVENIKKQLLENAEDKLRDKFLDLIR